MTNRRGYRGLAALLALLLTLCCAPGALADRLARRGERVTAEAIASRISQTCRPVYLGGRDRRRLG